MKKLKNMEIDEESAWGDEARKESDPTMIVLVAIVVTWILLMVGLGALAIWTG